MPLDYCHPNTPHKKLRIPEWYVSALMMDRALDAVVRRAKTIDRSHESIGNGFNRRRLLRTAATAAQARDGHEAMMDRGGE